MTCALLAIARDEDRFLDEWIQYHLYMGFDHIHLIDNNDKDTPINYSHPKVTIYRMHDVALGKNFCHTQCACYNKILDIINNQYDYCAICDIDEFFCFKKHKNVHSFIKTYLIEKEYNCAEIAWEVYDDNDLIYHINKPVRQLYTRIQTKMPFKWVANECSWGKSIFKLCNGIKTTPHWPEPHSMKSLGGFKTIHISKDTAVCNHYRTKCLEDYLLHKCKQCNAINAPFTKGNIIKSYFDFNDVTIDKLLYALKVCSEHNIKLSDYDKYFILSKFNELKLLTVVIRTHNRLSKLKQAICQLNNQTCVPEILVLDDNSQDKTRNWLSKYKNINYVSFNKNLGPGEILMRGRYMITTPYYIIMDDDDIWKHNDVVWNFYNCFIEKPDYDIYDTGGYLHVDFFVKTDLLLKCPMLPAWSRDDWYFDWIKRHGCVVENMTNNSFYCWNLSDENDHASNINNTIIGSAMKMFYNGDDKEKILNEINCKYHLGNLRERKVFDQIRKYFEDK